MTKATISKSLKQEVQDIFDGFNTKNKSELICKFRGKFMYIGEEVFNEFSPLGRLEYNGSRWEFAVFKWSNEKYDSDELLFTGAKHLNGTVLGALKACLELSKQ